MVKKVMFHKRWSGRSKSLMSAIRSRRGHPAKHRYRRRRRATTSKRSVKRIVNRAIRKNEETHHLDHKFAGSQGATYSILPWGVDSDLARGTVCGDLLPINQLDNIHQINPVPPPGTDAVRQGNEVFLKSIRVQLRLKAPMFVPVLGTPITATSIIKGAFPDMLAKVRLLVVFDTQGEQSLPLATTTTGVLAEIYQDLTFCVANKRSLATFKGYRTNKRFKVLATKVLTLNGCTNPFRDVDMTVKVNKKITYIPATDTCQQGIYIFAMSDYPATTASHTQDAPGIESFWVRYYYSDA